MWEHGTVGIEQKCMPSTVTNPFDGVPALDAIVNNSWVLVATDYAPNSHGVHPYMIGQGESRSAVDSVRAARQLPELTLDKRTVAWGHSQGGQAVLSTGIYGPGYAPDVSLTGIAAFAPATNIEQLMVMHGGDASAAQFGAYLATAYSQYYPDVKLNYVIPPNERQIAAQLADLCDPKDTAAMRNLTEQLNGKPVIADPSGGAIGERLRQNAPNQPINISVLVVQGLTDEVVYPTINDSFVDQRCAAGQHLDYWRVPGRDHVGVIAPESPITGPLIAWTQDRLAGKPQTGCSRVTFGG
jgi:pimeloyl-ACP methyl ester carboxylesterase